MSQIDIHAIPVLQELRRLADRAGIPIHMDGARLFNAATAAKCSAEEICKYVDSVMFCISKGLGAPIGSMLCGKKEFILEAAKTKKLLGGSMRQAGVFAACGLYALEHNVSNLAEDHRRAKMAWEALNGLGKIHTLKNVQSNILMLDISDSGLNADEVIARAKEKGLWLSRSTDTRVRMVFYNGITDEHVTQVIISNVRIQQFSLNVFIFSDICYSVIMQRFKNNFDNISVVAMPRH